MSSFAPLKGWVGNESVHRTEFQVPSIITAYISFMNAFESVGQMQSTIRMVFLEERIPISIEAFFA